MRSRIPVYAGVVLLVATANLIEAEQVYLSEIHYNPKGSAPEYLEVTNSSASVLDLAEWEFTEGISYVFPEYSDGDAEASFLKAWERIIVAPVDEANFRASYPGVPAEVRVFGPWSGALSNSGERVTLRDKNGILLSTVDYGDGGRKWPVAADGVGHSLRLKSLLGKADDWRNWETSLGVGGTPGVEPQQGAGKATASPLIDLGAAFLLSDYDSSWRYHDLTPAPAAGWQEVGFNDASWGEHPGMFGFDSSRPLPAPGLWEAPVGEVNWRRDSIGGLVTWYARKAFVYNGPTEGASLDIEGFLDDGAVFYLNGEEIARVRMPAGAVDHHTAVGSALAATENTTPEGLVSEDVSPQLVQGVNVLAVEVHNESTGSSDIVFGTQVVLSRGSGDVVINEVLPGGAGAGFVEIYNGGSEAVDLAGYYLSDDRENVTKSVIGDVVVPAAGFATLGFAESGLAEGGEVFLTHPDGVTVLEGLTLAGVPAGESIGRKPSGGGDWFLFSDATPGGGNVGAGDLAGLLELSEVHFDGAGNVDWVEVYAGSAAVAAGELFLASKKDLSDKVALSGTVPRQGYRSWDVAYPVGGDGELTLFVVSAGGVVVAEAEIDRNGGEESFQVFPAGSGEWYGSAGHTRDAANAPDRQTDVVINELMVDPPSDSRNGEYVELYNRGGAAVDLSGWSFVDGIGFEFPAGTSIAPGGYLVVAANRGWIGRVYGGVTVVGDYTGNLSNGGELLRLVDANGELVDEVDYRTGGDWPVAANGDGSSMELVHPMVDNDLPSAWRDSDESGKTAFQGFEFTGEYSDLADERTGGVTDYKELHLHLVGDAHVVLKNIRFERGGADLLENAGQDSPNGNGRTGWLTQGTHHASHFEGDEFHLIADGHGDNRANRAEIDCTAMRGRDVLTLKFDGRWVSGKPTMIAQTFDHSWAKVVHFPVPENLGTPGAANSIVLPSAPPVAGGLRHDPAVPTAADNVVVTARVSLPEAGGSVELRYRADSSAGRGAFATLAMNDDGSAGDALAGDGIWSGQITDMQGNSRVVQFYVSAKSPGGAEVTLPAGGAERPAMYVVDNDSPNTDLKSIRWVISEYDRGAWATGQRGGDPYHYKFPKLSNSYKNMTMIVNESEIIYNAEVRPSGSPWHTGSRAQLIQRAKFKMPNDHLLHGISKYSYDNTLAAEGQNALYNNKLPRYWLYLMGHEHNESEFMTVVDGTVRGRSPQGIRNAVEIFEPIGNDFLERNFGDDGPSGELYRVDDIFRFSDADINGTSKSQITDRFWWYAGDQWEGPGRYHTQWLLRSNEAEYDYSTLINMLGTLSKNRYTQPEIERLVDPRRCALMMAVRGYLGDWDNITLNRPKNSFFYRPPGDGKFFFFHHDSDLGFQGNHANDALVATHGNNRELRDWVRKPYNERMFRYYLAELLEKYTLGSTRVDTWFALEEAASSAFRPNSYRSFFSTRNRGSQMVGSRGELRNNLDVPVTVNPVADTGADTISLTGTAGYRVWEVMVEGHPEAEFSWTSDTEWRIDGIVLTSGANALNVIGVDDDGKPALATDAVPLAVTKTGDGTPVAVLDTDPKSRRLSVTDVLELDARDSRDPEGEVLGFSWTTPASGVAGFLDQGDGRAAATFEVPGLYDFGVNVTDGDGPVGSATREISVYGAGGFSSFGDAVLEGFWGESNTGPLANGLGGSWYSLEAESGRLTLFVPGTEALPLALGAGERFPWISRALPEDRDWVLETELEIVGVQFGDFMTGLMVSVMNGAAETRYAWGYTEGNTVSLVRVNGAGATTLHTVAFSSSDDVVLRVRREGAELLFDWRHDEGDWTAAERVDVGAAAMAGEGGMFISTGAAETVRVAFDYVMLIDPVQFSPFRGDIVVSEIMYKPDGGSSYEFLELYNTTGNPIALEGFGFPQGSPVDAFTFGGATLAGGDYGVVVSNFAAFNERYGAAAAAKVMGVWTGGNLSNSGERVTLLDADGLVVFAVDYSDSGDWPEAADSAGASLVLVPGATDPVSPSSWSASMFAGGSPGGRDGESLAEWQARSGVVDLLGDTDGNGVSALLTYALGLDLAAGGLAEALPVAGTTVVDGKTYGTLTFRRRVGSLADGVSYAVEMAQGLSGWSSAAGSTVEVGNPDYVGDGTEEVTVRSTVALEDGLDAVQMRLRVSVN